jgi:hypothetical protein
MTITYYSNDNYLTQYSVYIYKTLLHFVHVPPNDRHLATAAHNIYIPIYTYIIVVKEKTVYTM